MSQPGTLYVVATPIGNLGDLSPRARTTLSEARVVAAEDTRTTGHLLHAHGISASLVSFYEQNERERLPELLARLAAGDDVALCTDAGTPAVSDPGYRLIAGAVAEGIRVVPIPGPSAVLAALVGSGLPTAWFRFEGFLPRTSGERRRRLETLHRDEATAVIFESAGRLGALLADVSAVLGADRQVVVARELTKKFEEFVRGSAAELAKRYEGEPPRGEIVVVIDGYHGPTQEAVAAAASTLDDAIAQALAEGLSPREIYKRALAIKEAR